MTTGIQIVYDLLEELGGPVINLNIERYRMHQPLFERVTRDLRYITSGHDLSLFDPRKEDDEVTAVERYLEITRHTQNLAQELFDKTIPELTEEEFEDIETLQEGEHRGSGHAFAQAHLENYMSATGEYPEPNVFRRNADTAILDAEESPQFQYLVNKLKAYRSFLDSLPQS